MEQRNTTYIAEATADKLSECLDAWQPGDADGGVLAFIAEADKDLIGALQQACNERQVPLFGALFPALIVAGEFLDRGVLLLPLATGSRGCIVEALKAAQPQALLDPVERLLTPTGAGDAPAKDKGTLLIIFDALVPTIESLLAALYRRIGNRVHYLGGNAGSETFTPCPCLFDNQQVVDDAVLVLSLPDIHGGVLAHGYRTPEQMITATSTQGNRIASIDWRPALEVYSELALRDYGVKISRDNFYEFGVHYPFGIVRASGEVLVRIPVAIDEKDALFCIGEVPENAILTLLQAEQSDAAATVDSLTQGLVAAPDRPTLTFYCAGRRMHDPALAAQELQTLNASIGGTLAGAVSLGEIGSLTQDGYPLFHNATLVCATWK